MTRGLGLLVVVILLMGCAAGPQLGAVDEEEHLSSGIWDVEAGQRLSVEEFVDHLEQAQYVLVGESHGDRWHHEVQRVIYSELSDRKPGRVALGMEMIEARFQDELDRYLAGELDEEQMLDAVQWSKRWGVDPEEYAPMWRRAKQEGQAVVGLNARRELVRAVGQQGLEGLSEEEETELPEIDDGDGDINTAYRQYLREIFAAHGNHGQAEGFERFFQAQLVWDETMAHHAFSFLDRGEAEQMVILAGRGHVERGWGIPSRLERRGADEEAVITVVPVTTEGPRAEAMEGHRKLSWLQGEEIADFVWIQ